MKPINARDALEVYLSVVGAQVPSQGQGEECLTIPELADYASGRLAHRHPHIESCASCQRNFALWTKALGQPPAVRPHARETGDAVVSDLWKRLMEWARVKPPLVGSYSTRVEKAPSLLTVVKGRADVPPRQVRVTLSDGLHLMPDDTLELEIQIDGALPLDPGEIAGLTLRLKKPEVLLGSVWLHSWVATSIQWPLSRTLAAGSERWHPTPRRDRSIVIPPGELAVSDVTVHRFACSELLEILQERELQERKLQGRIAAEAVIELDDLLSQETPTRPPDARWLGQWADKWSVDQDVWGILVERLPGLSDTATRFLRDFQDLRQEELCNKVKGAFRSGAEETLEVGMESELSHTLRLLLEAHQDAAVAAISDEIEWTSVDSVVAAYVLQWLAQIDHPSTHESRLSLLTRCLWSLSARIRDAAALGLDSLDDPRAVPDLKKAIHHETNPVLREDMRSILDSLERDRGAEDPAQD